VNDSAPALLDPRVREALDASGLSYDALPCDPEHADTAVFCVRYGYPLEDSVNCIVVKGKTGGERFTACVLLASTRLDVNRVVRKRLQTRRISFASAEETREMTGMEIGGVTPLGLPPDLPVWVDARVMERQRIILGGGNRSSKIVVSPRVFACVASAEIVEGLARAVE
jgi:prolyl-tRNA editing enzyme YbaK/EbsC (Cys-tRNA(Pro) deacylase)